MKIARVNLNARVLFVATLSVVTLPAVAQTLPATAQPWLGALTEESVIPQANVALTQNTSIAPDVLAAIQAGALEIHQLVNYYPDQGTLQLTGLVLPVGSPLATPILAWSKPIWSYTAQVQQVRLPTKPLRGVVLIGSVTAVAVSPTRMDMTGAPLYFSASYKLPVDGVAGMQFGAVTTSIPGLVSTFSPGGTGNAQITLPTPDIVAPVAIAGPKGVQTTSPSFLLDSTQSYDPTGGPVGYQWSFQPVGGQTITLTGGNTATPTVVIPQNGSAFGDYKFVVMVINSAGLSSTDTVTVSYVDINSDSGN